MGEAADFARVLPSFRKVTRVFLNDNKIGDAGAAAIAAALPVSMVEVLNLPRNCIGYAGAASLAEILPQSKLRSLSLWDDKLTREEKEALKAKYPDAFKYPPKIS